MSNKKITKKEFIKTVQNLAKQGYYFILAHGDVGDYTSGSPIQKLHLIHLAEVEKEYIDMLKKERAIKYFEEYLTNNKNSNKNLKVDKSYMG